jgi:hypothetical protein
MKGISTGLFVSIIALSAGVYTNIAKHDVGNIYVQESEGIYTQISPWDYIMGNCIYPTYNGAPCSVQVTLQGYYNNVEAYAPFTYTELYTFLGGAEPWLVILNTESKIFVP